MKRSISTIAFEIQRDWKTPFFGAVPYLQAMKQLSTVKDNYGYDDARSIVLYFLSNAGTYRGDKAKELKAELKALLKQK
jgi:hypothetical protein